MLPASFSPVGDYTQRQQDRARGYRLLAHAEIESFVEDITFSAAVASVSAWSAQKKVSNCLFCLIAHYHDGFSAPDQLSVKPFPQERRPKVKSDIKEVVDVVMKQYREIHSNNHGVREENLLRLILPIGVKKADIDHFWMTNLSEFGRRRGEVAHQAMRAQQAIDPQNELMVVNDLISGLGHLDYLVQNVD